MPTYQYNCAACNHCFEKEQSFSETLVKKCPVCKKNEVNQIYSGGVINYVKGGNTIGHISDENFKREGGKIKEKIAKEKEESDSKLPWWRSGKVKGLEKQEKIIKLDKIKNVKKYIEKGEKT